MIEKSDCSGVNFLNLTVVRGEGCVYVINHCEDKLSTLVNGSNFFNVR